MNPLLTVQYNTGITLTIPNQLVYSASTYFSKDQALASNSLNVLNGFDFTASTGVILIGAVGAESTERRTVNTAAANVITVTAVTDFAHNRGEVINQIAYDQVVIESASSSTGTFSTLATLFFSWTALNTIYQHTAGLTSTYYRIKYFNSVTSVSSAYSNGGIGVSSATFDSTTVAALIQSVRESSGNSTKTDQFFIGQINDARKVLNEELGFGRVNEWRQQFEYPIQMLAGNNYVALPSTIEVNTTNRYLLNARFARQSVAASLPLKYVDKRSWNSWAWLNRFSTTTAIQLTDGVTSTTLPLSSTGDFPTSGTVYIATTKPNQSVITATYTGNLLNSNILTGVTGITRSIGTFTVTLASPGVFTIANHGLIAGDIISFTTTGALPTGLAIGTAYYIISTGLTASQFQVSLTLGGTAVNTSVSQSGVHTAYAALPVGTQVSAYPNATFPYTYTVYAGNIWFNSTIPTSLQGKNLYIDFYTKIVDLNYTSDVIPEPHRDVYKNYMRFAIKRSRDDSIGTDDEDYKRFIAAAAVVLGNPWTGQSNIVIT